MITFDILKKSLLVPITVFFSFFFISGQAIGQTDVMAIELDSLKLQLSLMEDDSNKVKLLVRLSHNQNYKDWDTALNYAEQALALSEEIEFARGKGLAYEFMASANSHLDNYSEAIKYMQLSINIYEEINDKVALCQVLSRIGGLYEENGLNERAVDYFLKSLRVAEVIKDTAMLHDNYTDLGRIYSEESEYDSAILCYSSRLALLENQNEHLREARIESWIGIIYLNKKMYDSALYYFNKSLLVFDSAPLVVSAPPPQGYTYVSSAGAIYHHMGLVFTKLGKYDSAERYQNQALEIAEKSHGRSGNRVDAIVSLGDIYHMTGRSGRALLAYKKAESIMKSGWYPRPARRTYVLWTDLYKLLTDLYVERGDYENAFKYNKLLTVSIDSIDSAAVTFKQEIKEMEWTNAEKEYVLRQDILEGDVQRATLVRNYSFLAGGLLLLIVAGIVFQYRSVKKKNNIIAKEKKKSDDLLLNILPEETASELMQSGHVNPQKYALSTVLFTDFKEFTEIVDTISPDILVKSLDYYFQEFDRISSKHNLEKIKTIGDAYMCVGGIPTPNDKNPIDVLKAAIDMLKFVLKPVPEGIEKFEIRIGIHTGPIIAGIVGIKKFQYDVWGSAVNIASLMETNSEPQKINISQNTYEYVKYEFNCTHRGQIEVKHGKKMDMYFVDV